MPTHRRSTYLVSWPARGAGPYTRAAGGKPGEYGFAMNDAASEKYIDDIKDKKAPLIFQSTDASWNAHGDPAKIGRPGGIGIAADGSTVKL